MLCDGRSEELVRARACRAPIGERQAESGGHDNRGDRVGDDRGSVGAVALASYRVAAIVCLGGLPVLGRDAIRGSPKGSCISVLGLAALNSGRMLRTTLRGYTACLVA